MATTKILSSLWKASRKFTTQAWGEGKTMAKYKWAGQPKYYAKGKKLGQKRKSRTDYESAKTELKKKAGKIGPYAGTAVGGAAIWDLMDDR